ncbi:MAG: HAMP domain-containing sensor histidine kinase [Chloroflexota bacterium]
MSSVRRQLLLNSLLASLAAVLVVGVVTLLLLDAYFKRQEQRYVQDQANQLVGALEEVYRPGVNPAELQRMVVMARLASQVRVQITDAQGHLLADSGAPPPFLLLPPNLLPQQPPAADFSQVQLPQLIPATSDHVVRQPLHVGPQVVGYVEFSEGPALRSVVVGGLQKALLGGAAAALLLAAVVGYVSARQVTEPLERLGAAADAMSAGDLQARAPASHLAEYDRLAAQFNQMTERLMQTIAALEADRAALRHLIADASHELRTPLSALKTFNELMAGEAAATQEPLATFVRESQRQLAQLDRITAGLLDLSRLEAGLSGTHFAMADLRPAIEAAVQGLRLLAATKRQHLTVTLPETAVVLRHDATSIQQAVGNLVSNAVKYTPEGGAIQVRLAVVDQQAVITVDDNGPGIAADEQPLIFNRFYRGRHQNGEGSGLGLAIAQEIVKLHQGEITCTSQAGQGSVFRIKLPVGDILDKVTR